MAKKGKKGKKGKGKGGPAVPEIVTTHQMVRERERMCCPRLGDASSRLERADDIRLECVFFKIRRAAMREQSMLDLSRSNLAFVPPVLQMTLELSTLLVSLDLSHNQLFGSEAVFESCSSLSALKTLDLSYNFLNGVLCESATRYFPQLEVLKCDANQLTALPDSIGAWRKIRHFSASKNALTAFPESAITEWKCLEFLNLRSNSIAGLPVAPTEAWAGLEVLYLGSNALKELPSVEHLVALQELDLRGNQLSKLPDQLEKCTKLTKLHLGNNKISEVPAEVLANLTEIEELHLYKNKIDSLPAALGSLSKIRRLTLSSNSGLKTLPDTIAQCKSLTELYVNNCAKFASFPSSTGDLLNLEELQAKKCPGLKTLPSVTNWDKLRELDLRAAKKQICKIPPELIAHLEANHCKIRGGVQKKAAKAKKKK